MSTFIPNTGKYGPEITPHLEAFPAVLLEPGLSLPINKLSFNSNITLLASFPSILKTFQAI